MFNARAFETGRSAFHFKDCEGFVAIAVMILIGQVMIVNVGDELFNVVPLHISDWVIIILSTSSVLWIGELLRWWERRLS
jgi:Ca2+-transporting ATPase